MTCNDRLSYEVCDNEAERLIVEVADLINRQKAEIESLQKRIVFWQEDLDYRPKEIRAEAIKEFDKRFTKELYMLQGFGILVSAKENK